MHDFAQSMRLILLEIPRMEPAIPGTIAFEIDTGGARSCYWEMQPASRDWFAHIWEKFQEVVYLQNRAHDAARRLRLDLDRRCEERRALQASQPESPPSKGLMVMELLLSTRDLPVESIRELVARAREQPTCSREQLTCSRDPDSQASADVLRLVTERQSSS